MLSSRRCWKLPRQHLTRSHFVCNYGTSRYQSQQKYDRNTFLDSLNIKTFSDEEIDKSFNRLKSPHCNAIVSSDINKAIEIVTKNELTQEEISDVASKLLKDLDAKNTGKISRKSWEEGLRQLAGRFDYRVKPLVACYLITGE